MTNILFSDFKSKKIGKLQNLTKNRKNREIEKEGESETEIEKTQSPANDPLEARADTDRPLEGGIDADLWAAGERQGRTHNH